MGKNLPDLMLEQVPELYLNGMQDANALAQQLESLQATQTGVGKGVITSALRERFPNYKEPADKEARRELSTNAAKALAKTFAAREATANSVGLNVDSPRPMLQLFEENEDLKNQYFADVLENGNAVQKHHLIEDMIKRMASVNPEEVLKMDDATLVKKFGDLWPAMNLAMESKTIFNRLKDECEITPEETERFNALRVGIENVTGVVKSRMALIASPCYAEVDLAQLGEIGPAGCRALEEAMPYETEAAEFFAQLNLHEEQKRMPLANRVLDSAALNFENAGEIVFVPDRSGTIPEDYMADKEFLKDLREGKTVYAFQSSEMELPGNQRHLVPLMDFTGNGHLTQVPEPVEKPAAITRFFHTIATAIGLPGFSSCRDYYEYVNTLEERRTAAVEADKNFNQFADFKKAAGATRDIIRDNANVVSQRLAFEKYLNNRSKIEERMDAMVGPDAHLKEGWKVAGNYRKDEYQPEDIHFNRSALFTDKELSLIAFAGLSDPEVAWASYPNANLTKEEQAQGIYVHIAIDTIIDPRPKANSYFGVMAAGRLKGRDCVEAFSNGDPEPLGKLLGTAIRRHNMHIHSMDEFREQSAHLAEQSDRMLQLMDVYPELMEHSGLTEEDLALAQANSRLGRIYLDGMKAGAALQDAVYNGREMSPEEYKDHLADVFASRIVMKMEADDVKKFQATEEYQAGAAEVAMASIASSQINNKIVGALNNDPKADVTELREQHRQANDYQNARGYKLDQSIGKRPLSSISAALTGENGEKKLAALRNEIMETQTFRQLLNTPAEKVCEMLPEPSKLCEHILQDSARANAAKAMKLDEPVNRPRSKSIKQEQPGLSI